ncbi:hypothetical protein L7F22_016796 [Adiantum nelumboides]|nr:hypothetical protein [Adiantum nelumboides]
MATTCQLLLRGLDGRTSCLRFPFTIITGSVIQDQIATNLRLPAEAFLIFTGTTLVRQDSSLSATSDGFFPSCTLVACLRGGKGGFGSLLRGAATKAGQKKTSNFDACRDMSGRRLRHLNAEKKLKEWKAQAKERELEKVANEFLKKQVKRKEDNSGCHQVIEKFQEETSRAREEVESAVASGLVEAKRLGKRKVIDDTSLPASSSKRAHIWNMDIIEDGLDDETYSSSDNDDDSDECLEVEELSGSAECDSGSGAEKNLKVGNFLEASGLLKNENSLEVRDEGKLEEVFDDANAQGLVVRSLYESSEMFFEEVESENQSLCEKGEEKLGEDNDLTKHAEANLSVVEAVNGNASTFSLHVNSELNKFEQQNELGTDTVPDFGANVLPGAADICKQTPVNLDLEDFLHASDLEVLGLDRLKHELQKRGLKCGGSLAERAGRLFLLKTISLEKLDKKHFAKAKG